MPELSTAEKDLLADTNFKVAQLLCKQLGVRLDELMTTYKSEASFVLASIQSIIINKRGK